jgi:hypothetical protein
MTRSERLAKAEASAKEALEAERQKVRKIQAAMAVEARKATAKRRSQVGTLADEAGLLQWDDPTLAGLFAALGILAACPHPVAVLEGLLSEVERPPMEEVAV